MTDTELMDMAKRSVEAEARDPGSVSYFALPLEEMTRLRRFCAVERVRCGIDHPDVVRARMGLAV